MLPAKRRLRNFQPQFTPRQLFAAMRGAWLEPPTGVQLGPELVTNGNFANGTTGWSGVSSTIAVVSNRLRITNTISSYGYARTSFTTEIGKTYCLFPFYYSGAGDPTTPFNIGSAAGGQQYAAQGSSLVGKCFVAINTIAYLDVYVGVNTNGAYSDIDNISVREVLTTATPGIAWQENTGVTPVSAPAQTVGKLLDLSGGGNNATQATAANRPTYQLDANNLPLIRHDTTDYLTASLPNLGGGVFSASGSVYFATPQGMSCVHNKSMGTTYNLPALSTDVYAWCVTPARLNAVQEAQLERYFLRKAGIAVPDYLTDENGYILTDDNDNLLLAG